ncbi:maleylpyruvate isomerase family mycothiol-dependent enzyme [Streptomyces barringtoniae]|uniref:maleylpyruvate isomerase family mycothiol-dependent enzyme n=1 Tax=Streptomyces barringtoniae TaxID=2892029 RepID=UPI001E487125|nr:maleylpyruvate isomerase family mycothiol-dependent enzyme [Streptomyces barringtoniae]MCC5479920.1 maleylpyruvate isomerase family mycothiol-dependent enzyme [Streptomyces barringtoniae]
MTDVQEVRDPELPGRLLTLERDALIPLLRSRPDADFALPTAACPGWSVRDVLAHCSAALLRVVEGRFEKGVFSPESNDRDIAERAAWPNARVVDELERGMTEAGPVIARAGGVLDMIALGEWVHAGDVREVFDAPGAYAGAGLPDALTLLVRITREKAHLPLHADLDDMDEPLRLGAAVAAGPPARYIGGAATLVRLYAGRPVNAGGYELAGAREGELNIFG